ncbi:MAG: hypothetical protein ACXVA9_05135 [Bdellovibrionales bacterium]
MQLMTPQQETERWVLQLLLGLWDLSEGILLLLILSWGVPKVLKFKAKDLLQQPFETPYLASFFAEYLRLLAQVLMWGLLLIVPGFIRYCQLIFVPLIAMFSKSYREGETDALRLSEKLTKGRLLTIVGIMLGTMALQFGVEFTPQILPDLHILPLRVLFAGASFLISVWTYSLIFLLFDDYLNAEEL